MVKKIVVALPVLLSILGCGQRLYKIGINKYGEPILNDKVKYSFTEIPDLDDLKKIDTATYYIQIFPDNLDREEIKKNPRIIIFHNDGFFKNESLLYFGKFDEYRGKNSVYYGGKYRIHENILQMEQFGKYPGYKKWYRRISEGKIEGERIIFKDKNSVTIFEKSKTLPKIEN
jgi:hypothetical protein